MKPIKMSVFSGIALILIPLLLGCATKIKTTMLCPARASEAAKLRRVAVLPFAGRKGDQISADLEALLVGIRVDGKPYFSVTERTDLKKILREQRLHLTGALDEKTAITVGRLIGADGIIFGAITQNTTEDKHFSQQCSECISRNNKGKCKRWRKYSVSCTKRDAYFSFTPKIVNVSTGQIVASEILTSFGHDRICQGSGRPLQGRRELLTEARRHALGKFRELVAPYPVRAEITLLKKDDTNPPSAVREKIKNGVDWAKSGRLDRACELWHEAYNLHPQGYAIHYLLGFCAEISGNLNDALSYYKMADRATAKPVQEINEALERIRVNLQRQEILEGQLHK